MTLRPFCATIAISNRQSCQGRVCHEPTKISDRSRTDKDLLHYEDFQAALYDVVTEAETPLTVGVFGPWGSGKTSLMRMLRHQLEQEKRILAAPFGLPPGSTTGRMRSTHVKLNLKTLPVKNGRFCKTPPTNRANRRGSDSTQ
jgi:energy-coupling factor transporter ATP-binding protein EcfA2